MRKILLVIFLSIAAGGLYPQENSQFFPENIPDAVISGYIKSIVPDEKTIRSEYGVLLDFIDEGVAAFRENIDTAFRLDKSGKKYPGIRNGKPTICEKPAETVPVWDNELQAHKQIPHIRYVEEMLYIIFYMRIYNQLLDHWLANKNELLRNYKDIDKEIIKIQELIKSYENAGTETPPKSSR